MMRQGLNSIGRLAKTAVDDTLVERTIEFIWDSLTPWRNDPERADVDGEEELNAQLQNFLEVRSRQLFPMVFFQHEQRQGLRRRVDIAAKPVSPVIVQGITYNKYLPILVIEGKRLPAPSKEREREYVTGGVKLSGGIQRFKLGLHGNDHEVAVIVGYVQKHDARHWHAQANDWIAELAKNAPSEWAADEMLSAFSSAEENIRFRAVSKHRRTQSPTAIQLIHLWIQCIRSS
jgi:hypothetical protein